jgi:hypothetical protein
VTEPTDPDDIVKRTLGGLKAADKEHERLRKRVKRMALFEDVNYVPYKGAGLRLKKKAVRQGSDPPAVQMMIERRNRYETICSRIAHIADMLANVKDAKEIEILTRTYATLEKIADGHLAAIETALNIIGRDASHVNGNRTRLLTSAAKLSQDDRHHQEKLALAKSQNPSDMSDAELLKIANAEVEAATDADA